MSKEELAAALNGREFKLSMINEIENMLWSSRLVVIYGDATDNVLRLANVQSHDEVDMNTVVTMCFEKNSSNPHLTTIAENDNGDVLSGFPNEIAPECIEEPIEAWVFYTEIPHSDFTLTVGGKDQIFGIVFCIDDLKPA